MSNKIPAVWMLVGVLLVVAIPAAMWWQMKPTPAGEPARAVEQAAIGNVSTPATVASTASVPVGSTSASPGVVPEGASTLAATPATKTWVEGAYMAASDWENAGIDTPEDALQTLLWAKKTANKDVVAGMTVRAAPVVIDTDKDGTANAESNPDGPTVVTPGNPPEDPEMAQMTKQMKEEMQQMMANSTAHIPPGTATLSPDDPTAVQALTQMNEAMANTTTQAPPDDAQLAGGTIVSRQEISPSEVQFNVSEDWAAGNNAPDTQTQAVYDFTLDGNGWKITQHSVTVMATATMMMDENGNIVTSGGSSAGAGQ